LTRRDPGVARRLDDLGATAYKRPTLENCMDLRRVRRPLATWLLAFAALGCGSDRFIVVGTARAPSTSGYVIVKGSSGSGVKLVVHMAHLHPVDSLDPALHAYVVWFEEGKTAPVRAGALHYLPDDRVGELEAISPFRKFVVKITAEANDKPSTPSGFIVATQAVSADD
jgi:hypothetical protein